MNRRNEAVKEFLLACWDFTKIVIALIILGFMAMVFLEPLFR